jgi:hypothetical protein
MVKRIDAIANGGIVRTANRIPANVEPQSNHTEATAKISRTFTRTRGAWTSRTSIVPLLTMQHEHRRGAQVAPVRTLPRALRA